MATLSPRAILLYMAGDGVGGSSLEVKKNLLTLGSKFFLGTPSYNPTVFFVFELSCDEVEKEWKRDVVLKGEGFMYSSPAKDHCLKVE